jgi:fructan beta-fructosidase
LLLSLAIASAPDRPDILVADFEGETYGTWTATGTAFGAAPARGTLPGQMTVEGFQGRALANSFVGGDDATGTLTSSPFRLERRYLNFLIGGGKYPGETCLNLRVDGAVVRTATGPNDQAGGSERLEWATWDLAELNGRTAILEIVDQRKGGWGHVNVDQIVQSDAPHGLVGLTRELAIVARYLHLPVRNDAVPRRVRLSIDGRTAHDFDIKLADERPDFYVFLDLGSMAGKRLRIDASLPVESQALASITQADEVPGAAELYREPKRPQFHFTSRRGWLNDPNGMVWNEGEYHLFYQHNPYGWDWGNMHWGHAVSGDLVHWRELPIALYPRQYGDWCFSGSAVVDRRNTSGFGTKQAPALVAAFTSTGRGECIIYSNDHGRTWTEFSGNPVVRHRGRDPRLLWHEATTCWVMAVYDETDDRRSIVFHSSPDLKTWTCESRIDGFFECPDLFELPVVGEPGRRIWVLYGADGEYVLGRFDGRSFVAEPGKHRLWHGDFYAAQTFSDTSDGRRIQIGWARGAAFPGMPFNQQMTVPCELSLRQTPVGVRMFGYPVAELKSLRTRNHRWKNMVLRAGHNPLAGIDGELFEIGTEAELGAMGSLSLTVRGIPVVYDAANHRLSCGDHTATLETTDGAVRLRIFVDRGSIEVFANDGQVVISRAGVLPAENRRLQVSGDDVQLRALEVDELASAWRR